MRYIFQASGLIYIYYVVISYLYAYTIADDSELTMNMYNFVVDYSNDVIQLLPKYITMIISLFIGWKLTFRKSNLNDLRIKSRIISIKTVYAIAFLFVDIFLLYLIYGDGMFSRADYHPKDLDYTLLPLYKVYTLLLIVLIYLSRRINNLFKIILIFTALLVSLSIASRITGIYLSIVFAMYLFTTQKIKSINVLMYLFGITFLILFSMYSRGMEYQGLINYIVYFDFYGLLDVFHLVSYYNTGFSVFVSTATYYSYMNASNLADFIIMINPAPGYFSGWYDINHRMTVMPLVPYTAVGIVFTYGYFGISAFYIILGVILGYIDSFVQRALCDKKYFIALLVWSIMLLFVVYHNQYTLRTSTRYLYYAMLIIFINRMYIKIYNSLKKMQQKPIPS